ncbi:MAG: serine/threonine-protein kinase [Actinobacteria bacterium]|nr:serine/threonine-protein kinase [Actinomycetota bacterium]
MPLASHIQLPERYRVTRHIASGGMASVWEVEDLLLGRVVAVKVLGAQFAADAGARARFAREARTAARAADHPHIATIYDIGEHGEDAFIVMEYFSGGTVADRLRAASSAGRRVPRDSALRWLREAASGLDHAHAAGIVHRDVKPANLLLDGRERLAVGDFGIARLADDTHMTQTGQLLGTAAYLSPEQALGQPATAASDRYALAVVAYELVTGTRPFAGGPPTAQVRQHAEAQPQPASEAAPDLPAAIDRVFARALSKDPGERPTSAAELVDEIERALAPAEKTERTRRLTPIPPPAALAAEPAVARGRPRQPAPPPPQPPPRQPPPPPAPDGGPPPQRARSLSPLVPIGILAAIVGVVLAIALGRAGDDSAQRASSAGKATQAARERTQTSDRAASAPAQEEQPAQSQTVAEPAAAPADPVALNDQGFRLNQQGRYAEAVPLLQASVDGYRSAGRTSEIGYAYALYNLGVALNRSGNPAAAVEVLQERLEYPNQRGTVQQELRDAQAKLGEGGGEGDKDKPDKKDKKDD